MYIYCKSILSWAPLKEERDECAVVYDQTGQMRHPIQHQLTSQSMELLEVSHATRNPSELMDGMLIFGI